jgi:hypothetical protein
MRRIAVVHDAEGWTTVERWTTRGLKPYFNEFVVHEGHAYGFDGSILACIDLADGDVSCLLASVAHAGPNLLPTGSAMNCVRFR